MDTPNQRVEAYLPLAARLASYFWRYCQEKVYYGDLYGDACVGLVQAANRYDPATAQHPFEAYAYTRIRGAILDAVRCGKYTGMRRTQYKEEGACPDVCPFDDVAGDAPSPSVRVDVKTLTEKMSQNDVAFLAQHYFLGYDFTTIAKQHGHDKSWASRKHQDILRRAQREVLT